MPELRLAKTRKGYEDYVYEPPKPEPIPLMAWIIGPSSTSVTLAMPAFVLAEVD